MPRQKGGLGLPVLLDRDPELVDADQKAAAGCAAARHVHKDPLIYPFSREVLFRVHTCHPSRLASVRQHARPQRRPRQPYI